MKKSKLNSAWMFCEKCFSNIPMKDIDIHKENCPPNLNQSLIYQCCVRDKVLFGTVGLKTNEDIKGLSSNELDNLVFLSQSAIQLCELSIGSWAIVQPIDIFEQSENVSTTSVARIVWPTIEKSLTSVLFTKTGLDVTDFKVDAQVTVERLKFPIKQAKLISVVILNGPKGLDINKELRNRLNKFHIDRILTVGNKLSLFYFGKVLLLDIKAIEGDIIDESNCTNRKLEQEFDELEIEVTPKYYKVVDKSGWSIYSSHTEYKTKTTKSSVKTKKIGGLEHELSEIHDLLLTSLYPKATNITFAPCHGCILYGNAGTGKTLLATTAARSVNANVISVGITDIYSTDQGADNFLKSQFDSAIKTQPSIILIDELDVLCSNKRSTESEKRILATLVGFLDEVNLSGAKVFVLATCAKLDAIDGVLRRAGRFDRELEIPIPNPTSRTCILKCLLSDVSCQLSESEVVDVAGLAHGFVGSDLVALVSRAVMHANNMRKGKLTTEDFTFAFTRVSPSAMREVQIEVPNVRWSEIGGQHRLKLILRQAVEWPLLHAAAFARMGVAAPRGVLMYGPPGCSKTMIARALATESGLNFLAIQGPELFSKWVGESERAVREVFRKARQVAPSIIFFDEIDALGGERASSGAASSTSVQERVLAQLLTELDGVTALGDVTVVAATNRPDRIDRALLRPGRLDRIVYVPLPDEETRREILRIKFGKMPIDGVDLESIVERTARYSGAEINAVCHEAAMAALEDNIDALSVQTEHFDKALLFITPRTPQSLINIYEEYQKSQ